MIPGRISNTPSKIDKEFVVASVTSVIANLELIENVILGKLAIQKRAPYGLIKTRAENERSLITYLKSQAIFKYSVHHGQISLRKNHHSIKSTPKTSGHQKKRQTKQPYF